MISRRNVLKLGGPTAAALASGMIFPPLAHAEETVTLPFAKKFARQLGFQVKGVTVSRRRVPDGIAAYGSQHGLLLIKPL